MHDKYPSQEQSPDPRITPLASGPQGEPPSSELAPEPQSSQPQGPPEPEHRSRKATVLAMGAVMLALGLIWMAPGIDPHSWDDSEYGDPFGDAEDAAAVGQMAQLDFTLKDMHGADVRLADYRGEKIILLNFWATWCAPCRIEIPDLIALQDEYADDLIVLGFSVDDPAEKLLPYAEDMQINYPILVGNGRQDVQDAFGPLWGIPVTVIIDREGRIAARHSGIRPKEQFEREIQALL